MKKHLRFFITVSVLALSVGYGLKNSSSAFAAGGNFFGSEVVLGKSVDPTKPVPRGYIVPSVEAAPNGAKLTVDIYQDRLNSGITLWLQAVVNDGNGGVNVINIKKLSDNVKDNPVLYHSQREFNLNYAELNQDLAAVHPKLAQLKIGPGTPLFVYATFEAGMGPNGQMSWAHQWGGVARGGIFFMPEGDTNAAQAQDSVAGARRATELDVALNITDSLALKFNDGGKGLKVGGQPPGQIRSRVETEGKFQIPLKNAENVKKQLFKLAENPDEAKKVLGPDWKLVVQDRYMKRDAANNLIRDAAGLPIPDPMVDTYYDNDNFDAAKNDMAIRYRWTEGNQSGSWNFKPGLTKVSDDGIVDRVEFGVDTTDDQPSSIAKFVDSTSPVNPFRHIRTVIPGATPSEFLKPAVEISDTRYKFMLEHTNGVKIEVSLDDAQIKALRAGSSGSGRFVQLEMDVDHLSTKSLNVASPQYLLVSNNMDSLRPWLDKLTSGAFFDGRPVFHDNRDLEKDSPVKIAHEADFKASSEAIIALRDYTAGKDWLPAPQKYSFSATSLGLISRRDSGPSTKTLLKKYDAITARSALVGLHKDFGKCGMIFN